MNQKGVVVLVVVSIVIVLIIGWVSTLPKVVNIDSCVHSNHSPEKIKRYFSEAENWKDFLFWSKEGGVELPERFLKNGPLEGVGAGFKWLDKKQGDGALEILSISDTTVSYQLVTGNGQFRERGSFEFTGAYLGDSLGSFCWKDTLDLSTNVAARLAANDDSFSSRLKKSNDEVLSYINQSLK